ncbi:hypothetical protein AKJ51_03330, partial [candidate division MSBL1 archaeon SCGC-AAA382A20]
MTDFFGSRNCSRPQLVLGDPMIDSFSQVSSEELLQLAEDRIFSLGPRDLASALSYQNMRYGLGKMIYALEDDAYCVFGPDATITRNKGRWTSGYGYGGVIHWKDENVVFPDLRPNGCGMLLMGLHDIPDRDELVKRAAQLNDRNPVLDDIEVEPDLGAGNHFLEFYEPMQISKELSGTLSSYDYFAILHGSGPELKEEIYSYADGGNKVETPLGETTVLYGDEADGYYAKWERLESFSKRRREFLAEKVVETYDPISNYTHQGLFSRNEARLGCYDTMDGSGGNHLFPLTLRWDTPVYIFKGESNLSEEVLQRLGFLERAERLGLEEDLKKINILPHGGGYKIELDYQNIEVTNTELGNVFTLSNPEPAVRVDEVEAETGVTEFGGMSITNPRELPYTYRGKMVVRK